jgi:ADP-heptose:LPS heptosyltransferase
MTSKTLPIQEISNLGYTIQEFKDLGIYPDNLAELREHPIQMVIGKFLVRGKTFMQDRFIQIKPNMKLVMDINDFIAVWHHSEGKGITGNSLDINLYQGEDLTNKKLLFWSFGPGWGDLLFIQAILRNIKIKYPTCKITWALPQIYHSFVRSFNTVNKIVPTPFEAKYIKQNDYHLHFDALVNHFQKGKNGNCYELMNDYAGLGISKEDLRPQILVMPQAQKFINKQLESVKLKEFIVLHLNTSSPMRNPRVRFKLTLLDKLLIHMDEDIKVVFVDSADKKKDVQFLIDQSCNPDSCYNFCGETRSMMEVAALLSKAQCVVSVDTSIIHMATAVGTPTYGLYGPFSGEQRLSTYENCKWVNGTCPISPCCLHQQEECPQSKDGFSVCYDNIDLDHVIKEIKTLI